MDYFMKHCRYGMKRMAMMLTFCILAAASAVTAFAEEESKHTLTWMADGEVLEEQQYQEGDTITAPEAPEKDRFLFKEWKNLPETMPAEDLTVTGLYQFAGTLVTDQENVYKCELKMSGDMAVTMYLRIDADGNFVFSRSTDFSNTEKGAGKVYKWTPGGSLQSGTYAVDISWSPMAGTLNPVIEIDADAMTFRLYGADAPDTGKGSGSISYEDDVYTMHFADSEDTTTFTFEDGALTFTSKLWYGTASFNREDEAGSFVTYTAEQTEASESQTEAAEAQTEEAESQTEAAENQGESADGVKYYLVYYVVNGEAVAEGDYITEIDLSDPDTIRFLSPFWFGATEPKLTGEDGTTVEYPEFAATDEEITADINKDAIVSKSAAPADSDAQKAVENAGGNGSFRTGTYGASHKTTAMGQPLTYACTITFRADGSYTYQVRFHVMGNAYSESESGTYQVNGGAITLVSSSGKTMSGSIGANSVTITRRASSFAFSDAAITFTYGYSPSLSSSTSGSSNGKETEKQTEKQTETDPAVKPSVNKEGLISGNYDVDISWSPMGAMISPVLRIDADAMTFQLYNRGASATVKGSGTISHNNGVFTLNYSDGHKTTFTVKDGTLSFTSKLWYGTASFNNTDASGAFVSYTAQLRKQEETEPEQPKETEPEQPGETNPEQPKETEPEQPGETNPEQPKETEPEQPGETNPEQPKETEPEQPGETDPEQDLVSGNYSVDISSTPMAGIFFPILTIDAEKNTFNLYNDGKPQESKGSGTIAKENGIYTLNYADGRTTSFTFAGGVITFQSKLWYGGASFNNVDEGGNFVPFTAKKSTGTGESGGQESEKETEPTGAGALQTGTYGGTLNVSAGPMGTMTYVYSLTLNADNTYLYNVKYTAMGTPMDETETGTYRAEASKLSLTAKDGTEITGTINADGSLTITRSISVSIKGTAREIRCVYGYTAETVSEQMAPEKSIQAEPEASKESETETAETETADTEASTETEAMTEQRPEVTETAADGEPAETEAATETETEPTTEAETAPEKESGESEKMTETAAAPAGKTAEPETERLTGKETEKATEKVIEKATEKATEKTTEAAAE